MSSLKHVQRNPYGGEVKLSWVCGTEAHAHESASGSGSCSSDCGRAAETIQVQGVINFYNELRGSRISLPIICGSQNCDRGSRAEDSAEDIFEENGRRFAPPSHSASQELAFHINKCYGVLWSVFVKLCGPEKC